MFSKGSYYMERAILGVVETDVGVDKELGECQEV